MSGARLVRDASAAGGACGPGLESGLLIYAQDERFVRGMEVEPHNIAHLLDKQWVGQQLERTVDHRLRSWRYTGVLEIPSDYSGSGWVASLHYDIQHDCVTDQSLGDRE